MTSVRHFPGLSGLMLLLGTCLLTVFSGSIPGLRELERYFQDVRVALMAEQVSPHADIVVIEVTESTYETLERRSPLDRRFLSELLGVLEGYRVKAVGVDIIIDQVTSADEDKLLANVLNRIGYPVYFAHADSTIQGVSSWQAAFQNNFFNAIDNPLVQLASVVLSTESDGRVREFYSSDARYQSLSHLLATQSEKVLRTNNDFKIQYLGRQDRENRPFNTIAAEALVRSNQTDSMKIFMERLFLGKLVLIGTNVAGQDQYETPFSADKYRGELKTAGVFIHAHILAQLLDQRLTQAVSTIALSIYGGLLAAIGYLIACYCRTGLLQRVLFLITLGFIIGLGVYSAMPSDRQTIVPVISPSLTFFFAFFIGIGVTRRQYQTQRDYTHRVLNHYVDSSVIEELEEHPEKLALGGERRQMSFIFTDIANFTTFTESYPAERVTTLLNEYLSGMSDIIQKHKGTIDKYIGDAIVAFWGAPIEDSRQAEHALSCAI